VNRQVRELIAKVEPIGWTYEGLTDGGHVRFRHTSGAAYTSAASPSDWRGSKNAVAEMERLGGQRLPRVNHRRGRSPRNKADQQVTAARRRHRDEWERRAEERENARQQEQQRRWAAVRAEADDRRRKQIEELMRP
jgi:hypothetical protein